MIVSLRKLDNSGPKIYFRQRYRIHNEATRAGSMTWNANCPLREWARLPNDTVRNLRLHNPQDMQFERSGITDSEGAMQG